MATSVERSIQLLRLLANDEAASTVSEIAAQLGTSIASASRLIQALKDADAISRDEESGQYRLSSGLLQVAAATLKPLEFRRIVLPAIANGLRHLGRPVAIGIPGQESAIWLETLTVNGQFIASNVMGTPIPYHATTLGKGLLAFSAPELQERVLGKKLTRYTDQTITDVDTLKSELATIRDCGFSMNRGEFRQNGRAIAVTLLNATSQPVVGFSVPAAPEELDPQGELTRSLVALGRSVSQLLGYTEAGQDSFV